MAGVLEALREAIALNPDAGVEDISEAIIRYLQTAVADVIRNYPVPAPQSRVKVALERYRTRRYRTAWRSKMERRKSDQETLIQELHSLRYRLNGRHDLSNTPEEMKKWNGGAYSDFLSSQAGSIVPIGQTTIPPYNEPSWGGSELTSPKRDRLGPYLSWMQMQTRSFRLRYLGNFADQLSSPVYQAISSRLEERLRNFAMKTSCDWEFALSEESDVELPTWKRYVLQVNVSGINFEEKIRLWDQLDTEVRAMLAKLAEDNPDKQTISNFEKSFFLRMDVAEAN